MLPFYLPLGAADATAPGATLVAAMDPEEYYDFQVNRPKVTRVNGERTLQWPTTRIMLARDTPMGRDVLLVLGSEGQIESFEAQYRQL